MPEHADGRPVVLTGRDERVEREPELEPAVTDQPRPFSDRRLNIDPQSTRSLRIGAPGTFSMTHGVPCVDEPLTRRGEQVGVVIVAVDDVPPA
jgi:hypothetical protein